MQVSRARVSGLHQTWAKVKRPQPDARRLGLVHPLVEQGQVGATGVAAGAGPRRLAVAYEDHAHPPIVAQPRCPGGPDGG